MAKAEYIVDNAGAARGRLPDTAMRKRTRQHIFMANGISEGEQSSLQRFFYGTFNVQPAELAVLCWSLLYIISVLSSYSILRPIRDAMGVAGGVENLPWLFTGTLVGMVVVNPPFGALVAMLPRVRFISIAYRFFIANLVLFVLLLNSTSGEQLIWVGRVFFVWTSVFNLFVVS